MAVNRQPLPILQDENAEIHRGKAALEKASQTELYDRKTLSNITNKPKPTPLSGFATPITFRKGGIDGFRAGAENANGGSGFFALGAKSGAFTSAKKGRAVPRDPLRNISNVDFSQSINASEASVKRRNPDPRAKSSKFGPNPGYALTEEMKQKADAWAREGIERVHFTGKDMEALRAKIRVEEINRRVEQALSYWTDIPCFLPCALEEDPSDIKDTLKFDVVDDFPQMADSLCRGISLSGAASSFALLTEAEDFLITKNPLQECIEISQNVSKDWPVLADCAV